VGAVRVLKFKVVRVRGAACVRFQVRQLARTPARKACSHAALMGPGAI